MGVKTRLAVAAALAALLPASGHAQWNNQPWSFGSGGSPTMSTAYRQAIMAEHFDGSHPSTLYQAPDGSLVTVTRRDGQAVLTQPQPYYLTNLPGTGSATVGEGGPGLSATVLGVGLSVGGGAIGTWTGMVDGAVSSYPAPARAFLGAGALGSPIDAWTRQLDGVHGH
jgi:hypothetical protein